MHLIIIFIDSGKHGFMLHVIHAYRDVLYIFVFFFFAAVLLILIFMNFWWLQTLVVKHIDLMQAF